VTGNPESQYVDPEGLVMRNLQGITDLKLLQDEEEDALAKAYERLSEEIQVDTPMTAALIRYVHRVIFGEMYAWAGNWRTVRISKPGASWPPPDFLDQGMQEYERNVLAKHPLATLIADNDFCRAMAHIQGEFLSIHPFREGNARTIKVLTDLLASQTGRPLLQYDMSPKGKAEYIAAAQKALKEGDTSLFEPIILKALQAATGSV
jgi:cell filamentation protein